jgi:hypothetical protein
MHNSLFQLLDICVKFSVFCICSFCVCQGPYDPSLVSTWEDWDAERRSKDKKHGSENENPNGFSEDQVII